MHKELVRRYLESASVYLIEGRADDECLRTAERVVAGEDVLLVLAEFFCAAQLVCDPYIFEGIIKEFCALEMLGRQNAFVHLILVNPSFEELYRKARKFLLQFRTYDLIDVDQIIISVL